jgi:hypothetical protein
MIREVCVLALALGAMSSAFAVRVLEQPEGAYELDPATVTLPASSVGSVIFRSCPDCSTVTLRVGTATTYEINRVPITFEEFLRRTTELGESSIGWGESLLTVFYDVETHRVTRIALFQRAPLAALD